MGDRHWASHPRVFALSLRALGGEGDYEVRPAARAKGMLSLRQQAQNFAAALALRIQNVGVDMHV